MLTFLLLRSMKNPCWAIAINQIHFAIVGEEAYHTYTVTLAGAKALRLTETLNRKRQTTILNVVKYSARHRKWHLQNLIVGFCSNKKHFLRWNNPHLLSCRVTDGAGEVVKFFNGFFYGIFIQIETAECVDNPKIIYF